MIIHCDNCDKELGEYLYGAGGVEERAVIIKTLSAVSMPDVECFDCWAGRNPKKPLKLRQEL